MTKTYLEQIEQEIQYVHNPFNSIVCIHLL